MTSPARLELRRGEGIFGGQIVDSNRINQVRGLVRSGQTNRQIQQTLRNLGIPLRNASIGDIAREFRTIQQRQSGLQRVRPDFRPGVNTITPTRINLATEFRYTVAIEAQNSETGETRRFLSRFGSNNPLTIGEIEDRSLDIAEDAAREYGFNEIPVVEIQSVEQRIA